MDDLKHSTYETRLEKTFLENEAAYWNAHVEFGTDEVLRLKWFYSTGFDAGYDYAKERFDAVMGRVENALGSKSPEVFLKEVKLALSEYKQLHVREKK